MSENWPLKSRSFRTVVVLCLVCVAGLLSAQDAPTTVTTPTHPGALVGEDARQAKQLQEEIDQLLKNEDAAQAAIKAKELLSFRQTRQGDKHWETANADWLVRMTELLVGKGLVGIAVYNESQNLAINAHALDDDGKHAEAQPLREEALDSWKNLLGEEHPVTAESYDCLAVTLSYMGKYTQAQVAFEKGLELRRRLLGEEHPDIAISYNNLAYNLRQQSKMAAAQPLSRKGVGPAKASSGRGTQTYGKQLLPAGKRSF